MSEQFPIAVLSLESFLQKDCGLLFESRLTVPSFGDAVIVLRGQHLRARLVRDRGNWFVEVNPDQRPDEWYDMALLKEQITGDVGPDELSFDQQAEFLRANWQKLVEILSGTGSSETRAALQRRRHERAKRRFPET